MTSAELNELLQMASARERSLILVVTNSDILQDMHLAERALRLAGQQAGARRAIADAPEELHASMLRSLQQDQPALTLYHMMKELEQAFLVPDYGWLAERLLEEPSRLQALWDSLQARLSQLGHSQRHALSHAVLVAHSTSSRN